MPMLTGLDKRLFPFGMINGIGVVLSFQCHTASAAIGNPVLADFTLQIVTGIEMQTG